MVASVLIDPACLDDLSVFLKTTHFFRDANRQVYQAELSLYERNDPIDQLTVAHELDMQGNLELIGGVSYLAQLIHDLPTSVSAVYYGTIVHQAYIKRCLITFTGKVAAIAWDSTDATEAVRQCDSLLDGIKLELGQQPFILSNLRKLNSDPPYYTLSVNNKFEIRLSSEELLTYKALRAKVMQMCNFVPPPMKNEEWTTRVNRLLSTVQSEDVPLEASDEYHIWLAACALIREMPLVDTREEFLAGHPVEKGDNYMVKGGPFFTAVKQRLKATQLKPSAFWATLRRYGVRDTTTRIGGKIEGCWAVPLKSLEEKVKEESDDLPFIL